jgi:hypothetical protein
MSFKYVYDEKSHLAAVLIVEFVEGGNLPPKWRSRVAAEYEHYRTMRNQR